MENVDNPASSCISCPKRSIFESQLNVFARNVARADTMADELFDGSFTEGQLAAEQMSHFANNPQAYITLLRKSVAERTALRHEMLTNVQRGYALAQQACSGTVCMLPDSIRDFDTRIPPNRLPGLPVTNKLRN